MAGWQGEGRDTIAWDGTIRAIKFIGDGSLLTGVTPTGGVTSWNTRTGAVVPAANDYTLDQIGNPAGNKTFNMTTRQIGFTWNNPNGNLMEFEATGAYTGSLVHIHQHTGNPGNCYLLSLEASDSDVEHISSSGALATTHVLCNYVGADTEERFVLHSDGSMEWGPGGSTAVDTNLYRLSANVLKTDDSLLVTSTCSAATLYAGTQNVGTHIASASIHSASAALIAVLTSSGAVIASGAYIDLVCPFNCAIQRATILPDASGSLVVNVKKCTYANYPGTFTRVNDFFLTSTTKSQTADSGAITCGDVVRIIASGAATSVAQATIALEVVRS